MTETWRAVPGYEGAYEVSDVGQVRSLDRVARTRWGGTYPIQGQVLAPTVQTNGYKYVSLKADGTTRRVQVHVLVLEAFVGPRPERHQARHLDGGRLNNALANLAWGTASANIRDKTRHGTNTNANKTHCPAGHPYTKANTYRDKKGRRDCRACHRERERLRRQRNIGTV